MNTEQFPKPEDIFNGKLPEDDVSPEQFQLAIDTLLKFSEVNSSDLENLDDLARVTRDLGQSVRRVILSCGKIESVNFFYEDPRTLRAGDDLIMAGDDDLIKQ